MKLLVTFALLTFTFNSFAGFEPKDCDDSQKAELQNVIDEIADMAKTGKYSNDLIRLMIYSQYGGLKLANDCDDIAVLTQMYKNVFPELRSKFEK